MVDQEGYIIGDWVKRYPTGRQLVVTSASVLKDIPNPYPHGKMPFVFAQGRTLPRCLTPAVTLCGS